MAKNWNLLKDRGIISLIIGDSVVVKAFIVEYNMPYMSGPAICDFGGKIGLKNDYWNDVKKSRQKYMECVIDYAISENKIDVFFKELLNLKRFKEIRPVGYSKSPSEIYWDIANYLMVRINEILFYDKCHIEYNFDTWKFSLVDDESDIKIESNNIETIDNGYIKRLYKEIDDAITNGDYESCITKSRTMLEEVMVHGIELKDEEVSAKGDITKLYHQFKTLYSMHQAPTIDKRINSLLSGFEKIITSISNMRDTNSDSHGMGKKRIKIEKHHAILFRNSSITLAEFLLSVINNKK